MSNIQSKDNYNEDRKKVDDISNSKLNKVEALCILVVVMDMGMEQKPTIDQIKDFLTFFFSNDFH